MVLVQFLNSRNPIPNSVWDDRIQHNAWECLKHCLANCLQNLTKGVGWHLKVIIDNMSINKYLVDFYLLDIIWDQWRIWIVQTTDIQYNTVHKSCDIFTKEAAGDQYQSSNILEHNWLSTNPPKLRTTIGHEI